MYVLWGNKDANHVNRKNTRDMSDAIDNSELSQEMKFILTSLFYEKFNGDFEAMATDMLNWAVEHEYYEQACHLRDYLNKTGDYK